MRCAHPRMRRIEISSAPMLRRALGRAAMLNTRQQVLRNFWYATRPLEALNGGPKPFRLLAGRGPLCRCGRRAGGARGPLPPPDGETVQGLDEGRTYRLRPSRPDI